MYVKGAPTSRFPITRLTILCTCADVKDNTFKLLQSFLVQKRKQRETYYISPHMYYSLFLIVEELVCRFLSKACRGLV